VGEIATCGQFHQHISVAFVPMFLLKKLQSQTVSTKKLHKTLLYVKFLSKMWVK